MSYNLDYMEDDSNMPFHCKDTAYTKNGVLVFKADGSVIPLDYDPSIIKDDSLVTNVNKIEDDFPIYNSYGER